MIERENTIESLEVAGRHIEGDYTLSINSNEKLLFILNGETGLAPYSHEFVRGFSDPQILSGFISAISNFISEATGSSSSQWKTVLGLDSIILVEGGKWAVGVLIAERETSELRSKLRNIVREFEDCFEFLRDVEGIQNIFSDFDDYVRRVFVDERVTSRSVVTKIPNWRNSLCSFDLPSAAFEVSKMLLGFGELTTIQEISEFLSVQNEKVIETISLAFWKGLVKLTYIPLSHDILALSEKASSILFRKNNPLMLPASCLKVVTRLDGRTSLSKILDCAGVQENEVLESLGSLINDGFVQRISIERRLVLFNECILSNLVSNGASIVGIRSMKQFFEATISKDNFNHPWIGRVSISDDMHVQCFLEESMAPRDLDEMCDTLEFFIKEMTRRLSMVCGVPVVERLLHEIRTDCYEIWSSYLTDVVI